VTDVAALLREDRLLAIVRVDEPDDRIAELLAGSGIRAVEISLASAGALPAISRWAQSYGEDLAVGAGTVVSAADAERAFAAGARFFVAPGYDEGVDAVARDAGVLYVPGAMTPTEVQRVLASGRTLVKLFPAGRLGAGYVRDLLAPFPQVELLPTGGIDLDNAREFLAAGAVAVAVGSALVRPGIGEAELAHAAAAFRHVTSTNEGVESHAR
jgi:2-dehydro-3-deoxyphosphogluconate aldolase/(4S)-4-hydroxy-2-oxoglutarate aldolase